MQNRIYRIGLTLFFWQRSSDNILSDIIILGKVEQFPDFAGSLGSQTTRNGLVSKAGDILFSCTQDK